MFTYENIYCSESWVSGFNTQSQVSYNSIKLKERTEPCLFQDFKILFGNLKFEHLYYFLGAVFLEPANSTCVFECGKDKGLKMK